MSNRPLKLGGMKPKGSGLPNSRQELKARLGAHIPVGGPQKRTLLTAQPPSNVGKRPKLDFKSGGLSMPSSSNSLSIAGGSNVGSKCLLEVDLNAWREYSSGTEVNPKTFDVLFTAAKETNKQHKMARMVCAVFKEQLMIEDASEMNMELLNQVIKVTFEEDQLLKNNNQLLKDQFVSVLNAAIAQQNVSWPLVILNLAINDSLGARNWVDRADTQSILVQIVSSFFGTLNFPSEQASSACELPYVSREVFNGTSKFNKPAEEIDTALKYIIDFFEKQIRIDANVSKNLLKTLAICSANPKIRCLCAQKLDAWLQNGKLQNYAKELLLYIASNTRDCSSDANLEVLLCLVRLRGLRSKQILHVFTVAMKDLLCECPGSLPVLTNLIMDNEFSPNKFQHNMSILQLLFNHNFIESSDLVSKILIKRIENADNVKGVRLFLKDFVRSIGVRADFSFSALARAMFASFRKASQHIPRQLQDQFFRCCVDVCSILPFVGITTGLKESVTNANRKLNPAMPCHQRK
uniref:DUF3677 domain-containing protein n=1 Tax=Ditylenchus dipsaci TaxID=166011 RepID=A0A915ERJ0_9BILA